MKTIQKILIVIGFATAPIVLSATWNLQSKKSWIAVRFIEMTIKSIK